MKKISVLLIISALFLGIPCQAGIISTYKAKVEQNKILKSDENSIRIILNQQTEHANKHDALALESFYSNDFINSDGFNKEIYFKLIKDTFESYPDITYKTYIHNIQVADNHATVYVTETAVATTKEEIGEFETVGELLSASNCIYHFEKHGTVWLIESEQVLEETSTLKYGEARYINIELNSPKLVGSDKFYTSTLKVDAPKGTTVVASISKENIVYPQVKAEEAFRRLPSDNIIERVFKSNSSNVNEYNVASIGITHAENYDEKHIKVYLNGLAFIMTRVNVIPENKSAKIEEDKKEGESK